MDTKTYRLLNERERAEMDAENEADYLTYDGVPIPEGPPR
jgi:hypothetical protein